MQIDSELCYRRLVARDTRFDGVFYVGVTTTGIYCRPICPARTPREDRCRFFGSAPLAERAGFRPCLRCRPELAPGLAPVDAINRTATAARARIEAGALDRGSLEDLAAELGQSSRQVRRAVEATYGVAPVQIAQTQRLLLAKRLLTDTSLRIADVAFASGFASLRRFNHLFQSRYGLSPGALRKQGRNDASPGTGTIQLRLSYRPPLAWPALLDFLAGRGAAGVETIEHGGYFRTVRSGGSHGWLGAQPGDEDAPVLRLTISESLLPELAPVLSQLRSLFDLDAAPAAIDAHLARDPRLGVSIREQAGLRVPGAFDGFELALRTVLGQQVSVRAATTLFGRFAAHFGDSAVAPLQALHCHAPDPARIAECGLEQIAALGVPRTRAATIKALARAVADGQLHLHPGARIETTCARLHELPGIGDWTVQYIAMRVLRDADAFPASDLGVLRALQVKRPRDAIAMAEAWRPWRAYAVMHLWQSWRQRQGRAAGG